MPKLSVIMPVYNTKEEYLRESIESILNQTFADFNFIIVNDASTNNAQDVILSYKDERIVYIKNEKNLGISSTLNKGIEAANSEYIIRMDSDDISLPERFEKQVEFMDKNPHVDISGTNIQMFPKNRVLKFPTENEEIKKFLLLSHNPIGGAATIFRTNSVKKFDISYDENNIVAEDLGLWLQLAEKAAFANLPEILYKYRFHHENISTQASEILQKSTAKLVIEARNKICKIDAEREIEIMNKLIDKKDLTAEEVLILLNNSKLLYEKLNVKFPTLKYSRKSAAIMKNALKYCKKDKSFIRILFNGSLYQLLVFGLILKMFKNSIFFDV